MPKRSSFTGLINQMARSAAKAERERQTLERAKQREVQRVQRETNKQKAQLDKEAKQKYLEDRTQETAELNNESAQRINELKTILEKSLENKFLITFDSLRIKETFPNFELPEELKPEPIMTGEQEYFSKIPQPTILDKLIPGWEKRHQTTLDQAKKHYEEYKNNFESFTIKRNEKITELQKNYNQEKEGFELRVAQRNQEIDEFETAYKNGDPSAVTSYNSMVLELSVYPDDFPQEYKIAYLPESKELVIEYELPNKDLIPKTLEYKYVKTRDVIEEKLRKPAEIKAIYQDVVSAVCLRTIHEVFEADQGNNVDVIVFNGFVNDVDPATGKDMQPCIITTRTTKDVFTELNLEKIDKKACLRNLGAQVSPRPDELMAVKPIVEFDMVDKRFIEESDILSDLENRPNLMELTPFEFEDLINNLFDRIGFDSKSTQASRDGGVDVVAFDPRPILGGKVVIQAKRYKNVVGVSAVRDLYGTMINEGANKGILVTTSHYGKDAYEFSKDKPIELIDGGGLLYLLNQNGVQAKIIFPED